MSGRERHKEQGKMPELYSIFLGQIASIQTYGAFVKIPDCRKNGLVHKTQISNSRIEDVSDVLAVNDRVYCKVISLGEGDEQKISLSMKVVNQDTGRDLDPNQVQLMQDEKRRKQGKSYIPDKIELGAVFNTTCKKCGCKGHLAQDCFKAPDGKSYELLPEDDSFLAELTKGTAPEKEKHKKKHKEKKQKKSKKKKKHKHRHESSSSESETLSPEKQKEHEKRDKRKHKRTRDDPESQNEEHSKEKKQRRHFDERKSRDSERTDERHRQHHHRYEDRYRTDEKSRRSRDGHHSHHDDKH